MNYFKSVAKRYPQTLYAVVLLLLILTLIGIISDQQLLACVLLGILVGGGMGVFDLHPNIKALTPEKALEYWLYGLRLSPLTAIVGHMLVEGNIYYNGFGHIAAVAISSGIAKFIKLAKDSE